MCNYVVENEQLGRGAFDVVFLLLIGVSGLVTFRLSLLSSLSDTS